MLRDFEREFFVSEGQLGSWRNLQYIKLYHFWWSQEKHLSFCQRLINWVNRRVRWEVNPWRVLTELTLVTGCSSLQSEGRELTGSRVKRGERDLGRRQRSRERGEDSRRIIQTGSDKLNQFIGSQSDLNYEPMIHDTDMHLRLIRVVLWQSIFKSSDARRHQPLKYEYQYTRKMSTEIPWILFSRLDDIW